MNRLFVFSAILLFTLTSCRDTRIKEHNEWKTQFEKYGVKNGCFMLVDHTHESVNYYNKERCLQRFSPASTFKIFNSLVSFETVKAQDESMTIPWDSVVRMPEWNHTMTMKEAFRVSNVPFFQELARRVGRTDMQHYLDTVKYGNMDMGKTVDSFWLDGSLKISADEQVGFLRKLYFEELPFTLRTQTIVRSMMLREDSNDNKMYYKTGWGVKNNDTSILWIVGFMTHKEAVKEHKNSMNKSDERNYPYIFALNFDVAKADTAKDWAPVRLELLKSLLTEYGAFRTQ